MHLSQAAATQAVMPANRKATGALGDPKGDPSPPSSDKEDKERHPRMPRAQTRKPRDGSASPGGCAPYLAGYSVRDLGSPRT